MLTQGHNSWTHKHEQLWLCGETKTSACAEPNLISEANSLSGGGSGFCPTHIIRKFSSSGTD